MRELCCEYKPVFSMWAGAENLNAALITCADASGLPVKTMQKNFGAHTIVRSPGALLCLDDREAELQLKEIINRNPGLRHIVVCMHSLCKYFADGPPYAYVQQEILSGCLQLLDAEVAAKFPDLNKEQRKSFMQQHSLSNMISEMTKWLRAYGAGHIQIHGWIYEAESNWISALDFETGLFLPLNAHADFC